MASTNTFGEKEVTTTQIEEIEQKLLDTIETIEEVLKEEPMEDDHFINSRARLLSDVHTSVTDAWIHTGRIKKRLYGS